MFVREWEQSKEDIGACSAGIESEMALRREFPERHLQFKAEECR
jgi:hypothetical protein